MTHDLIDFAALSKEPAKYAAQVCGINLNDIQSTMGMHPALVAYVVACYEIARVKSARAEENVKRVRGRAYAEILEREPKRAAAKIESEVDGRPDVIAATDEWLAKTEHVAHLKALVTGLDHRLSMLVQIASRQKQEVKNYS